MIPERISQVRKIGLHPGKAFLSPVIWFVQLIAGHGRQGHQLFKKDSRAFRQLFLLFLIWLIGVEVVNGLALVSQIDKGADLHRLLHGKEHTGPPSLDILHLVHNDIPEVKKRRFPYIFRHPQGRTLRFISFFLKDGVQMLNEMTDIILIGRRMERKQPVCFIIRNAVQHITAHHGIFCRHFLCIIFGFILFLSFGLHEFLCHLIFAPLVFSVPLSAEGVQCADMQVGH